ncbi:MAG: flagellar protein [Paenibacillaceae bacterium ZCTH02-B3]|nr:MAG: flagellar protein [Paenibacillaceae bacterium ZCTH02-B3]
MGLEYCPRCGKLFSRTVRDICYNCHQELEKQYERVVAYLKEHPGLTLNELAEATEVSAKQITRWVREGRISIAQAPNIVIACEVCGTPIREGTMCDSCRRRLAREVKRVQMPKPAAARKNEDAASRDDTYHITDRLRDR